VRNKETNVAEKIVVKMTLTPEQQAQIRQVTGKQVLTLRLLPLEERLAPGMQFN
jgi:hypothetical protein